MLLNYLPLRGDMLYFFFLQCYLCIWVGLFLKDFSYITLFEQVQLVMERNFCLPVPVKCLK